jgi:hypothetical protein
LSRLSSSRGGGALLHPRVIRLDPGRVSCGDFCWEEGDDGSTAAAWGKVVALSQMRCD